MGTLRKAEFSVNVNEKAQLCHSYPTIILDILRHIIPGNTVREFREVNSAFNFGCN